MLLSWTHGFMELRDHGQVIFTSFGPRWLGVCACLITEQYTWYWLRPHSFGSMPLWLLGGLGVSLVGGVGVVLVRWFVLGGALVT